MLGVRHNLGAVSKRMDILPIIALIVLLAASLLWFAYKACIAGLARVNTAGPDVETFPSHPDDIPTASAIPWTMDDLDAYFRRTQPGESSNDRKTRLSIRKKEWVPSFHGRLVQWEGKLLRMHGNTIELRCKPDGWLTDTYIVLVNPINSDAGIRMGDRVAFQARLDYFTEFGYFLYDGIILPLKGSSPPESPTATPSRTHPKSVAPSVDGR